MSVHDDQGHDEEPNIHQDDHQHWCNERPHKVSVRIQPASAGTKPRKLRKAGLQYECGNISYRNGKMQYLFVYIRIYNILRFYSHISYSLRIFIFTKLFIPGFFQNSHNVWCICGLIGCLNVT